jgi:hypothetical protein
MDPLCDPLTTRPIQMGWEFTMEPYPSGQFGFIDDPDRQFGNGSVWTRTRTRSDGPEPLLTLIWAPPKGGEAATVPCTLYASRNRACLQLRGSEVGLEAHPKPSQSPYFSNPLNHKAPEAESEYNSMTATKVSNMLTENSLKLGCSRLCR